MQDVSSTHASLRAAMLAEAIADVVAELRLVEPADLIGYIRDQKWSTIADLIQTSTELSFRDGTLAFACMADCEIDWARPMTISFDLEFQTEYVTAFFTLALERRASVVDLKKVWFASEPPDEAAGTRLFASALADARVPARRTAGWR